MGGAQPLAATMTGAAFLGIDVDAERIKKRLKTVTGITRTRSPARCEFWKTRCARKRMFPSGW
jgi:urocanate hydratase